MSAPAAVVRKNITRSRNGCAVCKSKRLKCDEVKPSCSRCVRLGIPCPGYQKSLKWTKGGKASTSTKGKNGTFNSDDAGVSNADGAPASAPIQFYPQQPQQHQQQVLLQRPQQQQQHTLQLRQHQLQPSAHVEQPTTALYPSQFLEQFTDFFDAQTIELPESNPQGSPFPFSELSGDVPSLGQNCGNEQLLDTKSPDSNEEEVWTEAILHPTNQSLTLYEDTSSRPGTGQIQCALPLAQTLQDHSSVLVEYYFKEVCGLMSCYDSSMNPYRTAISNVWSQSQPLYYITQSMAAACLSEVSPGLGRVGRQLRDEAVNCLSRESASGQTDTLSLLAIVMLGMSLSWHDPSSLGRAEFDVLSKLVLSQSRSDARVAPADKQRIFFFYNSLVYWKMLLSFVVDDDLNTAAVDRDGKVHPAPSAPSPGADLGDNQSRMPHPQTGVGVNVLELVAQVGSLVRRERKRIRSCRFASMEDIAQAQAAIQEAELIHSKLHEILLPKEATIIDSGDDITPATHLLRIAEAYRCTGLLQLYRNFPDLLWRSGAVANSSSQIVRSRVPQGSEVDSRTLTHTFLTNLALHILDLVQDVPISSRSRSIQPLLLVSICSELSISTPFCSVSDLRRVHTWSDLLGSRAASIPTVTDILHARRSILTRLNYFETVLAAKPIRRMITLVKETWATMDERSEDVFWMDVMMEKGYETLMG